MKWIYLHSSKQRHPSIFDEDLRCSYCGNNHVMDENGRLSELDLIGTSTNGMTPEQAKKSWGQVLLRAFSCLLTVRLIVE